jgi:catechol 2,3-dioxygenase-like lactoylglutathione lyase family enzyme
MTDPVAPRPSHLGLCVSDLDRALHFYCDGLGFTAAERYELDSDTLEGLDRSLEAGGHVTVVSQFIRHGALAIELLHYTDPEPHGTPSTSRTQLGFTHLAFHVTDLAAALARAVDAGGTVLEPTRASLGVELVFLADPDGNRVELLQMG